MGKKEYTEARRWAERALVNAQLAETKAEAEQTRRAAAELRQSLEALRRETEQPHRKAGNGGKDYEKDNSGIPVVVS